MSLPPQRFIFRRVLEVCVVLLLCPMAVQGQQLPTRSIPDRNTPGALEVEFRQTRISKFAKLRSDSVSRRDAVRVTQGSDSRVTFPRRTLIGAGVGAAIGLGFCVVASDGPLFSGGSGPVALVAISTSAGALIGYAFERR